MSFVSGRVGWTEQEDGEGVEDVSRWYDENEYSERLRLVCLLWGQLSCLVGYHESSPRRIRPWSGAFSKSQLPF